MQNVPHVILTLPIVCFQPLDPAVALLGTARVAAGAEFLRDVRENVTVVGAPSQIMLDLNAGGYGRHLKARISTACTVKSKSTMLVVYLVVSPDLQKDYCLFV